MKALILLSGGVDSAAALWWARARGWRAEALSFDFPGRRAREQAACRRLAKAAGLRRLHRFAIPFVRPPRASQACYIPHRNLMFYGLAASLAQTLGAQRIVGGHFSHDGVVFGDATQDYLRSLDRLVRVPGRSGGGLRLCFPFITKGKADIVRMGARLGVPFEHTWSCSHDRKRHCWKCNSCKERRAGFLAAGVADPLFLDRRS